MDFKNLTNDEIVSELIKLKENHESLKLELLKGYDKLEEIEKFFTKGSEELNKRLEK